MPPEAGVIEPVVSNGSTAPTDWRTFLTDDLKADPVVSKWAEKTDYKDVPSIIKGFAHGQAKFGSAINLPGKDANPEDIMALKAKLIEAGVMPKPIADPKEYAITKPENLPAGVNWSDDLSTKLATTLHKHQIPKEAVADLMALHLESLGGVAVSFAQDTEKVIAALRHEHGEKYDERRDLATRKMIPYLFPTDEEAVLANKLGLGDYERFVGLMMRFAPLLEQDSSFMESLSSSSGSGTSAQAFEELQKIQTDTTHPMYTGYKQNDPAVMEHIMGLYRKAYPGTVKLG